jgi:hypothetical protein
MCKIGLIRVRILQHGQEVVSEGLHLTGVQSESRGEYVCTAQNGVGPPLTKTIRITVNSKYFLSRKPRREKKIDN